MPGVAHDSPLMPVPIVNRREDEGFLRSPAGDQASTKPPDGGSSSLPTIGIIFPKPDFGRNINSRLTKDLDALQDAFVANESDWP